MARAIIGNADALPEEVERLIARKLRLMRRQAETRLGSVRAEMGQTVETHVRDGLESGRKRSAIQLRTLDAYREAATTLTQITSDWPGAVWDATEPILDSVSIAPSQEGAIARLLYTHAWLPDEAPWTRHWVDAKRFSAMVQRVMSRYGLASDTPSSDFEHQMSLVSSAVQAGLVNRGRIALGEAQIALDEYLLARRGQRVWQCGSPGGAEEKNACNANRHHVASAATDPDLRSRECESLLAAHTSNAKRGQPPR